MINISFCGTERCFSQIRSFCAKTCRMSFVKIGCRGGAKLNIYQSEITVSFRENETIYSLRTIKIDFRNDSSLPKNKKFTPTYSCWTGATTLLE